MWFERRRLHKRQAFRAKLMIVVNVLVLLKAKEDPNHSVPSLDSCTRGLSPFAGRILYTVLKEVKTLKRSRSQVTFDNA